jgi:GNAT superfamily N-acetyltransferase
MPYNPPSYPQFVEAAGYSKAKDLLAWRIDLQEPLPARIARLAARAARRPGLVVRSLEPAAFARDLASVQQVYREAWEANWGFVPPTDAEIRQLAEQLRPVLDPNIVLFAELDGRPVGCAVAVPDLNQVLKLMGGRLFPFGLVHFLRRKAIISQARVLLLGVTADARRLGLYPLLIAALYERGAARGYRQAELSWTLEDNGAINVGIEAAGGRRSKTYRLYEKSVR